MSSPGKLKYGEQKNENDKKSGEKGRGKERVQLIKVMKCVWGGVKDRTGTLKFRS